MNRISLLICAALTIVCFAMVLCACSSFHTSSVSEAESGKIDGVVVSMSDIAKTELEKANNDKTDNDKTADSPLTAFQRMIARENKAGAAFAGYVKSDSSEKELRDFYINSETGNEYPFLSEMKLVMAEGQELYAVIPVNKKGTVSVYSASVTDDGQFTYDADSPIYVGEPGEGILLRCNMSEIYSNVFVKVSYGDESVDFSPCLSMENGQMQSFAGVLDFSVYSGDTGVSDEVMNAYGYLLENDEIKYYTDMGMILQYTSETQEIDGKTCLVFVLGTDSGDQFVRELYYAVHDTQIYAYDAVADEWSLLGAG